MTVSAREFAIASHGDQKYSEHPYIYHLDAVAEVLREFGFGGNSDLMDGAYLHDVMEDCAVTSEDLWKAGFNRSWGIVNAVTDEPGKNRKERHAATYPKMAGWENATILKLADRIANVRECVKNNDPKWSMYSREYPGFRKALYRECHPLAAPMWAELDRIAAIKDSETPEAAQSAERLDMAQCPECAGTGTELSWDPLSEKCERCDGSGRGKTMSDPKSEEHLRITDLEKRLHDEHFAYKIASNEALRHRTTP